MNENPLHLQYESSTLLYTTQFVASMGVEEVVLDCGSMVVPMDDAGGKQLPIHTRMAMSWSAVHRLHRLLGELIQAQQDSSDLERASRAELPPLSMDSFAANQAPVSAQPPLASAPANTLQRS